MVYIVWCTLCQNFEPKCGSAIHTTDSSDVHFVDNDLALMHLFYKSEGQEYLDIGEMNTVCQKCGAMVWYAERTGKHYAALTPKISLCCLKGKD